MPATSAQLAWLKSLVPAAQTCARVWQVPASVTLAQCILESNWGSSQLCEQAKNYFGIKHSNAGTPDTYVEMPTYEYEDGRRVLVRALFVKYGTVLDSFAAHAHLLASAPRYRAAMAVVGDPNAFALELQRAYYSSSPIYAQSLIDLMREFDLYQYDVSAPDPEAAAQKAA